MRLGMDVARLNFSHGTHDEHARMIERLRKVAEKEERPICILQDLQGPKIRLGDFDGIVNVQKGQSLTFQYGTDYEKTGHLPTQYDLSGKVKRGERLYLYDGRIRTVVTSVHEGVVHVRAENDDARGGQKDVCGRRTDRKRRFRDFPNPSLLFSSSP